MIGIEKVNIKVPKNEVPQRGARKRAVAKVWIWEKKDGNPNPEIYVNKIPYDKYFQDKILQIIVRRPLEATNRVEKYIIFAQVRGSGPSAQAQAVSHGISRALEKKEPELRKILKPLGLLTRDPREVERKKYGRRKARKRQQWKKR
jgi:small subunit ribosomal protein S9